MLFQSKLLHKIFYLRFNLLNVLVHSVFHCIILLTKYTKKSTCMHAHTLSHVHVDNSTQQHKTEGTGDE